MKDMSMKPLVQPLQYKLMAWQTESFLTVFVFVKNKICNCILLLWYCNSQVCQLINTNFTFKIYFEKILLTNIVTLLFRP